MDYLLNFYKEDNLKKFFTRVLNLIINGLPSKQKAENLSDKSLLYVLNLIINGLPSKPLPEK